MLHHAGLAAEQLRAICDPATLPFQTTAELDDLPGGLGQARAEEALDFGLSIQQPGYNVFVMGTAGTGRHASTMRVLRQLAQNAPTPADLCYVHNFSDPLEPRLMRLPAGMGRQFRDEMRELIRDLGPAVEAALESETHVSRVTALQEAHQAREEDAIKALGKECSADHLSLLRTPEGFAFVPLENGKTLTPEEYEALPQSRKDELSAIVDRWRDRLADLFDEFPGWRKETQDAVARAEREALTPTLQHLFCALRRKYKDFPQVLQFLGAVCEDVLDQCGQGGFASLSAVGEEAEEVSVNDVLATRLHRYEINLFVDQDGLSGAPIIYEDNPSYANLIGRIEYINHMGTAMTHFGLVRAGALHRASGGYLVLDAERLLSQPYAWEGLKRVLRARCIMIQPPSEAQTWYMTPSLSPEAVESNIKVVLIGDREIFDLLSEHDSDFVELFKVAADFDSDLLRTRENELYFARLMATLARASKLLPLSAAAVASLIEAAARHVEHAGRLSLNTRYLSDLMREADFYARREGGTQIDRQHVLRANAARLRRAGRYPEKVLEAMLEDTILIDTEGARVGQVNALVVVESAGGEFGHPTRVTATIRQGDGDVIDIERETELGGALHSKGVMILTAFIAARFARHHPLSLSASLVFEQSYAHVDGDSASLAELCALLSAVADVPLRQSVALTGSVNQFGEVQAIGGVNEKIEGFFDLCAARGLVEGHGVIIPHANVRHLMLREDIVAAVRQGQFKVWSVRNVDDALEILTGMEAGKLDSKGRLPAGSLNHRIAQALAGLNLAQQSHSGGHRQRRRRHDSAYSGEEE
jgi:predicted ATP-dependent protease